MTALELLGINLHVAHNAFTQTTADITPEMLDWVPPGIAPGIAERYAHAVAAEDWLVQGVLRGGQPSLVSTWQDKAGFNKTGDFKSNATNEERRAVRIDDLGELREFGKAVFAATEEYLNSLDATSRRWTKGWI